MTRRTRGICGVCGYIVRLRNDGAVGRHHVYIGAVKYVCSGSGRELPGSAATGKTRGNRDT